MLFTLFYFTLVYIFIFLLVPVGIIFSLLTLKNKYFIIFLNYSYILLPMILLLLLSKNYDGKILFIGCLL